MTHYLAMLEGVKVDYANLSRLIAPESYMRSFKRLMAARVRIYIHKVI